MNELFYSLVLPLSAAGTLAVLACLALSPLLNKLRPAARSRALAEKIADEGRSFPKMYITCGDADPLYPNAVSLQEHMKELGADVTWVSRPGFIHEWRLWDEQIEQFLYWLPRTDAYAGSKRRI